MSSSKTVRTPKGDRLLVDLMLGNKSEVVVEFIRRARDQFPDTYGPMTDEEIMNVLLAYFAGELKKKGS